MPINTSMNIWSRIASNIDNETLSLNDDFDPFNKTLTEHSQLENKISTTRPPGKSCLLHQSKKHLSEIC